MTSETMTAEALHSLAYDACCALTDQPHDWIGYHWTVLDVDGEPIEVKCNTVWAVVAICQRDNRTDVGRVARRLLAATRHAAKSGKRFYGDAGAVCLTPPDRRWL